MHFTNKYKTLFRLTAAAFFLNIIPSVNSAFGQNAPAHAYENTAQITVGASGSATAKPDMALLQVSVSHEGKTAKQALAQTSTALQSLLASLKKQGLDDKYIQTNALAVEPVYHDTKTKQEKTYQATAQLALKIVNIDKLGTIIDEAAANGATGFSDLIWTNSDLKPLFKQAREKAITNALEKVKTYAQAAGIRTGRILRIEENSDNYALPRLYARSAGAVMLSAPTPVPEGEKNYTVQISLTMELLD